MADTTKIKVNYPENDKVNINELVPGDYFIGNYGLYMITDDNKKVITMNGTILSKANFNFVKKVKEVQINIKF